MYKVFKLKDDGEALHFEFLIVGSKYTEKKGYEVLQCAFLSIGWSFYTDTFLASELKNYHLQDVFDGVEGALLYVKGRDAFAKSA